MRPPDPPPFACFPSRADGASVLTQFDTDGDGALFPAEFAALAHRLGGPPSEIGMSPNEILLPAVRAVSSICACGEALCQVVLDAGARTCTLALHCTALCPALRCAALHCTALRPALPALRCAALHCTALHCAVLQSTTL